MNDCLPLVTAAAAPANLLCVDDEPNILSSLRRLFRAKGYRVLTAESASEGLHIMADEPIDLVISDMRMPGMDGAQFLEQVRNRWPDTIRMLLTGYSDIQSILDAINRGEIYRYITKPWDDNDILLLVRHALERRMLEKEKQRLELLTQQQNDALKALNASLEAKVEARTQELKQAHDLLVGANDKLKASFVTSIKVFSTLIEMRGSNVAGHARRVADLARKIAVKMAVEGKEVQEIFIAGLLHEIGKIGFSDEMLGKPVNMMNGETLGLFRKHPVRAEQLLMPLPDLHNTAKIVRSQLERFDGGGFPDRLSGFTIPLGARILAVASDYDNLQIGALVQRNLRPDEAQALILDSSGKRYDPQVIDAFRAVMGMPAVEEAARESHVTSNQLVPGMVLAQDLFSRDGFLLLSADHVFDQRLIQQIQDFELKSEIRLAIRIRAGKGSA
jgi:response regulator RpfG family c-di-GMP phosphodiesterase